MKQISRTPVPVPGANTPSKPEGTPLRTPVPNPSAKTTSKSKSTPPRTPVPIPHAKAISKPKATSPSTPVPLSSAKVPSKPKATPPKSQLSQEFIASSDDDSSSEGDESPGDAFQSKTVKKPQTMLGVHRPDEVVKSTPQPKTKGSSARKTVPILQSSVRRPTATPVPVPGSVAGGKRKADMSESENDSSETPDTPDTPDSGDTSESTGGKSPTQQTPQQTIQQAQPQSQPSVHTVAFAPTHPYHPPKGFATVTVNDATTSKVGSIFDNLGGKQIWHITAPAGVSLAELSELTMEDLRDGKTLLKNQGVDYRFSIMDKSENDALEIMIPRQDGYKAVPARISRTLRVQAAAQIPASSSILAAQNTGSEAAASITRSTIRAPRPQVKRLKMRFLPTGFVGDVADALSDSESEVESRSRIAVSEIPNELRLPVRSEKKKQHQVNGVETIHSTPKKPKKHRTLDEIKRREERRAKKEKKRAKEAARSQP